MQHEDTERVDSEGLGYSGDGTSRIYRRRVHSFSVSHYWNSPWSHTSGEEPTIGAHYNDHAALHILIFQCDIILLGLPQQLPHLGRQLSAAESIQQRDFIAG
jgi:hypothetical protein